MTYLTPWAMQRLYELGARRLIITGTGPLGCVSGELAQHSGNGECAAELNCAVDLFNPQLLDMVRVSNVRANREVYAFWDAFHPTERAIYRIAPTHG
ncbi:hypothetical protein ZWY2020_034021 [Hordeum vulgare]|nr:hypothetical protein ZWY2020_034021 [Hordeum vulgare]